MGHFLKKLSIELSYYPEIPHQGAYQKEVKAGIWRDIYMSLFLAMLFTMAKR